MAEGSREKRLADYTELLEGRQELLALQQGSGGGEDEEVRRLLEEAEEGLEQLARSLDAEETIEVTPGLVKVQLPSAAAAAKSGVPGTGDGGSCEGPAESFASEDPPVILYPPADQPRQCAPYEVLFDEREWYPCVISAVVPPATPTERLSYRAWILGYNVEETVPSEALRPWGKEQADRLKEEIRSGAACHAVRPSTGRYEAATVERLTLEGTVMVAFAASPQGDAPATSTECELPVSHVRVGGKFYPVLRKRPQLSEEERAARRRENAQKKRERAVLAKQAQSDKVAQDATDWQELMGDMMGGGSRKRHRR